MTGAARPGQIARRDGALIDYLDPLLAARGTTLDHAQAAALDRLQHCADELAAFRAARQSTLKRLLVAAGRAARRLSVGRRRARQELPDGQLLRDGADPPQDARALPRVHARRARGAARRSSTRTTRSRPSRRASPRRWRLVCFDEFHVVRHRRRDDPRAGCSTALFDARRRVRDDVELSARRRCGRTACSASASCRRSRCSSSGSTWSRSTPASTTGCATLEQRRDVPRAARRRRPTRRWRRAFEAMRSGPGRGPASSSIEGRHADRAAARGQRRLVRLRRAVRRPALAARLSRARRSASPCCSCPAFRG